MSSSFLSISLNGSVHRLTLTPTSPLFPQLLSTLSSSYSISSPTLQFDDGEDLVTVSSDEELHEAIKSMGNRLIILVNGSQPPQRRDSHSDIPDIDDPEIEDLYLESREQVPQPIAPQPPKQDLKVGDSEEAKQSHAPQLISEPQIAVLPSSHHSVQVTVTESSSASVDSPAPPSPLEGSAVEVESEGVGGYYHPLTVEMGQLAGSDKQMDEISHAHSIPKAAVQAMENAAINEMKVGGDALAVSSELESDSADSSNSPPAICSPVHLAGLDFSGSAPVEPAASEPSPAASPVPEQSAASLAPLISAFFCDPAVLTALTNPGLQAEILHGVSFLTAVELIVCSNPHLESNPLVIRIREEANNRKDEKKYDVEAPKSAVNAANRANSAPAEEKQPHNPNRRKNSDCWVKCEGKKILAKLEKIRIGEFFSKAFSEIQSIFDDLFDEKPQPRAQPAKPDHKSYAAAVGSDEPTAAPPVQPNRELRMPVCSYPQELATIRGMGFIDTPLQESTVIELLNGSKGNVEKVVQWITEKDLL